MARKMLGLDLLKGNDSVDRVLCLGSHCDDIEIGCGGTILKLGEMHPNANFRWVVFSSDKRRGQEAHKSASLFLRDVKRKNIIIKKFRASFFPYVGATIKTYFEELKKQFSPDLIFTHYRNDLHQDHRLISELTWNTFRDHLILEYEIPKYDGDLGCPNVFVHLDEDLCDRKIRYIIDTFKTQGANQWFTDETFRAILRLRGIESNSHYAEAFYGRKIIA